MDLENSWTVARKDLTIYRRKKSILYTSILVPVLVGIGFPALLLIIANAGHTPFNQSIPVFNAFFFWFIIVAALVPFSMASYTIIGEKVEKTLEPLLATPLTDSEFFLGKIIAALIPSVPATYLGAAIFMSIIDVLSNQFYYPNWTAAVVFVAVPIASLFSIQSNMFISARVNDIRTAQQYGGVVTYFPLLILFYLGVAGVISLDAGTLLIFSGILLVLNLLLFYINKATFQRESILTRYT